MARRKFLCYNSRMKIDYHVHTLFSHDGQMRAEEALAAAAAVGVEEICFTEHMDYDESQVAPVDVPAYLKAMGPLREKSDLPRVKLGVEIALQNEQCDLFTRTALYEQPVDFIIGSVHNTDEGDPYEPPFFEGRTKKQAYALYVENIARRMQFSDGFHVLGHYDYVAKNAPYPDRIMTYDCAPDAFDTIFRTLVERGQGMEYNTSAQRDLSRPLWGLDIWKRYVELGGFFATISSDAHRPEHVGWRFEEAKALLIAAGVKYYATFEMGFPAFHRL